ncbi:MAG: cytochrome c1 [Pseudomonadales bacterium]|jgi:ubiquinol-cytochrome c reductase cytochrome c1 subunit|nr:cytochrome c1 [Pseudomonadales bacterium]MCP5332016.1 cytochrome c1 [Pseudomonadales bacterium]HMU89985.1 cytochrome c1 [Pseudomonadales bacterium]HMW15288.1 cytochrome c1 [Pseudomonadales bacterium]HMW83176.1 cytochrome c1 [Pseudomonadales bacterium]
MKKILKILILGWLPLLAWASGEEVALDHVKIDPADRHALQRGAALYMNYCMGCHSLKYERYEKLSLGLGVPPELFMKHLVFGQAKIGDLMTNAMPPANAKRWFGATPPDLTLVTRLRGSDWVYSYLRAFYTDPARPWGVNNVVFKDVGMPNVLRELQGEQRMVCKQVPQLAENGGIKRDPLSGQNITVEDCHQLQVVEGSGKLSAKQFDTAVSDLVNFLAYVAEPEKLERHRLGVYVLLFLAFFFVVAYMLNREYWKDVH